MIFKNSRLKQILIASVVFMFGTLGLGMQANAQSTMGEVFICNYDGGNGMDDLLKAKDFYLKQAEKAGAPTPPAFVWTPVKVGADIDFLWFNYHQSAADYGATADAWAASPEIQAALERFNDMSTCQSALFTQEQTYNGGVELSTDAAYIQSSACNFRSGSDLADLRSHITNYLDGAGTHKSFILFERSPVTSNQNTPDVRFASIHNNASEWAARFESINGTDEGQMLARHFNSVLDCTTSHWSSTNMVPFPDQ